MKYKNTTQGAIYFKDGASTRSVSPGEEFETANLIGVEGISAILPSKEIPFRERPQKSKKKEAHVNVRNTDD